MQDFGFQSGLYCFVVSNKLELNSNGVVWHLVFLPVYRICNLSETAWLWQKLGDS